MSNLDNQLGSQPSEDIPLSLGLPISSKRQTGDSLSSIYNRPGDLQETDEPPLELGDPGSIDHPGAQQTDDIPVEVNLLHSPQDQTGSTLPKLSTEPLVSFRQVNTEGGVRLQNVSLDLSVGQLTCILGGSREGASSLLRILALEEGVTSGQVLIGGQDAFRLGPIARHALLNTHIVFIRQSQLDL